MFNQKVQLRIGALAVTVLLASALAFGNARAQSAVNSLPNEQITNFNSTIVVNYDNSIDVAETITYNTGPQDHHGIYRNIYPYSSSGMKMSIENVTVTDENNNPYLFTTTSSGNDFVIKIGDPNRTFVGQKIYEINYHATRAVGQLKNLDEIYWNVTGNDWSFPIDRVNAAVILPSGARMTQAACYYGVKGSTNQCAQPINNPASTYRFTAPAVLGSGQGLTVAVGFPKGIMTAYSNTDLVANSMSIYEPWLVAGILPLLTLVLCLWYWYRKGRDPKDSGVIVPQYDVPDNLTPMEVAGIVNQKVQAKNISSEIIYLATKGYLKITQLDERVLGLFKSTDYELSKLKDPDDLPNGFDRTLLWSLFGKSLLNPDSQTVRLSNLKNNFYKNVKSVIDSVLDALLSKGYYKNLGIRNKGVPSRGSYIRLIFYIILYVSIRIFLGISFNSSFFSDNLGPIAFSIIASLIIYEIISHFFPAKTEKGVATKDYILGLKLYLQIAEKDRLLFHDAPEKKPEVFEKLLPYAMVLGVADIWAKEFEGLYTTPPSWYSSPTTGAFNAVAFTHSVSHFGSSFATTSAPPGGGSGGGGFSGGGGGGGGGSW